MCANVNGPQTKCSFIEEVGAAGLYSIQLFLIVVVVGCLECVIGMFDIELRSILHHFLYHFVITCQRYVSTASHSQ